MENRKKSRFWAKNALFFEKYRFSVIFFKIDDIYI